MKKIFAAILILTVTKAYVQPNKDIESIKSLCGCFDVEFKYAETFKLDSFYKLANPYMAKGREWVEMEEEKPDNYVIQHLLVVNDTIVIKHWREDWMYQNTNLLSFKQAATWEKKILPAAAVKGQWTQTVWEVDDAPRYQGTATWIHADNKNYWQNNTDAPLPRREYTKRNDYNVLNRTNTVNITKDGWIHEQDNQKIVRKEGKPDMILVQEKGYNIYHKIPDAKCNVAKKWWQQNKQQWVAVRKKWNEKIENSTEIKL